LLCIYVSLNEAKEQQKPTIVRRPHLIHNDNAQKAVALIQHFQSKYFFTLDPNLHMNYGDLSTTTCSCFANCI